MKKSLPRVVALVAIIGLSLVFTYNNLATKTQNIDKQWIQVETQYQKRFNLIPHLVNFVKDIFEQEQEVFIVIAHARTQYTGAKTIDEKIQAVIEVESALVGLFVIMRNYSLQFNPAVLGLIDELVETENRVNVHRIHFNNLVKDYNATIKRFPINLIASIFNFNERVLFKAVEATQPAPSDSSDRGGASRGR